VTTTSGLSSGSDNYVPKIWACPVCGEGYPEDGPHAREAQRNVREYEAALRGLMEVLYVDVNGDLHGRDFWMAAWVEAVAALTQPELSA
jgi:hypothetical protein